MFGLMLILIPSPVDLHLNFGSTTEKGHLQADWLNDRLAANKYGAGRELTCQSSYVCARTCVCVSDTKK